MKKHTKEESAAIIARLEERAEKSRKAEAERALAEKAIESEMPFWPDEFHAMPNWLARGALFSVRSRKDDRPILNKTKIASRREVTLYMSGYQLDQGDADTWMHMIKLCRGAILGGDRRIHFERKQVLEGMLRSVGSTSYNWLEESIERLHTAAITIEVLQDGKIRYKAGFHLIDEYKIDKKTGEYWIKINEQAAALFGGNMYGYVDMKKRHALGRNASLAKWLYSYVVSHAPGREHSISVELLHEWCGTKTRIGRFHDLLEGALKALQKHEIISNGRVDSDGQARWVRPRLCFESIEAMEIKAAAIREVPLLE